MKLHGDCSEDLAASFFTVVSYRITTRRHSLEDCDFSHHRRENLTSYVRFVTGGPRLLQSLLFVSTDVGSGVRCAVRWSIYVLPSSLSSDDLISHSGGLAAL